MDNTKFTKGKWYSKVTRSSNINGDESVVVFSENNNSSIDKGVCKLTILNHESKVVQDINEMKSNALLISKAPEMLEMLQTLSNLMKEDVFLHETSIKQWFSNTVIEVDELIKQATEL